MRDWIRAINIDACPAVDCEAPRSCEWISEQKFPELHAQLVRFSENQFYDYYHCSAHCHRIWRIMRVDHFRDDYQPPECIGSVNRRRARSFAQGESDSLGAQDLKWQYCRSKRNPRQTAQKKMDAQR